MDIVFATHNKNKFYEVEKILPKNINLLSLDNINCNEEIIETADTIEGNALIKANYVFEHYNYPCFADDTGLFVEALNGVPGVYSARFAGPQKNADDNNNKLLQCLKNYKNRTAYFKTVIAYKTPKEEKIFTGICSGKILTSPKGHHGFGYDPLFQPKDFEETFATLKPEIKNKISHRALAMQKFLNYLLTE